MRSSRRPPRRLPSCPANGAPPYFLRARRYGTEKLLAMDANPLPRDLESLRPILFHQQFLVNRKAPTA
jgi:hypothetical protein